MSITRVQSVGNIASAASCAASITSTSGNALIAVVSVAANVVPTITDSAGQTWTSVVSKTGTRSAAIFVMPNSAAVTSVTGAGSGATAVAITVWEVSGLVTSSAADSTGTMNTNFGGSFTMTGSAMSQAAEFGIAAFIDPGYGAAANPNSPWTDETAQTIVGTLRHAVAYQIYSTQGTPSATATGSGYGDIGVMATFKGASGGGGTAASGTASLSLTAAGTSAAAVSGTAALSVAASASGVASASATAALSLTSTAVALFSVTATPSGADVLLSWPSQSAAVGYAIERDGALVAYNITGTSYTDVNPGAGSHTYRVAVLT